MTGCWHNLCRKFTGRLARACRGGCTVHRVLLWCRRAADREPAARRGSHRRLLDDGEVIGEVVRTRTGVKPVFVSVGHRVSLPTARRWVLRLAPRYRLPETTRAAHAEVNRLRLFAAAPVWQQRAGCYPVDVPRLSSFFGIVVYMYYDDHAPPHFHVLYEGEEAVFGLDGTLRAGRLPRRAVRLIEEWAEAHRGELEENWKRAQQQLPLEAIAPLR